MNGGSDLSVDIDKFTISVSGLTIIGFAKWSSLGEQKILKMLLKHN
jgi:hypothetical protein